MLKTLLKKQMAEIFRSYLYDSKKNRQRSKSSTAMFIVLYVFIMVFVLGGMFTMLSLALCGALTESGLGWLYFTILGLLAVLFGTFGSVFNTYAALYIAKDNDLLLSLPIPVRFIMISRLLGVYLMGLMYSATVIVPATVVYLIVAPFSISALIGSLLLILVVSVIVLILSCLLGWVVAKISLKLKNKSFITVIVSLLFFAVYYLFYFKAQTLIQTLLSNAELYGEKIRGAAYPLYIFGRVGEGNIPAMLAVSAVTALLFALMWLLLSHSFIKIATSSGSVAKVRVKELHSRSRSVSGAMLYKEFARFTSSPNYMLNCGLGTLLLPVGGVVLLIKGGMLVNILSGVFGETSGFPAVLICAAICLVASMNLMAAPSVSLEGKNLWLAQSLPVTPWQALWAKLSVQIILTEIPALFCSVCAAVVLRATPLSALLVIMTSFLYVLLSALFALFLGLKMPNLTWTNENVPIKQSMGTLISMFGCWGYSALLAIGYFAIGNKLGAPLYLVIFSGITVALSVLLYSWLKKKGTKIFAEL